MKQMLNYPQQSGIKEFIDFVVFFIKVSILISAFIGIPAFVACSVTHANPLAMATGAYLGFCLFTFVRRVLDRVLFNEPQGQPDKYLNEWTAAFGLVSIAFALTAIVLIL